MFVCLFVTYDGVHRAIGAEGALPRREPNPDPAQRYLQGGHGIRNRLSGQQQHVYLEGREHLPLHSAGTVRRVPAGQKQ
ncbi:jg9744, partial [Pararge aegeria aegeria]